MRKPMPNLNAYELRTYDRLQQQLLLIDIINNEASLNIAANLNLLDEKQSKEDIEELFLQALFQMKQSINLISEVSYRIEECNNEFFLKGAYPYSAEKIKKSLSSN